MIIEPNKNSATVTSNITGSTRKKMGFDAEDPEAMEILLSMLSSNLYNDPETAVIREYYTNAVDAHIKAGITDPVRVTLPSWSDPTYTVQDCGVGMSAPQIETDFAQFLASTKRTSILEMGAFGLGSKAGFAITSQFSLVTVQDGIKTSALFTMVSDGSFDYDIIASVPTEESNGTTVKIPVEKNLYSFNDKARKFFSFSESGKVILDGSTVTTVWDTYKQVKTGDEEFSSYVNAGGYGNSYIVMGTVPYIISDTEMANSVERLQKDTEFGMSFGKMPKIFVVPVGAVHLTPSREGLRYTEKTTGVLDKCVKSVIDELMSMASEEMNNAETLEEMFDVISHWKGIVPRNLLTYKGKEVPDYIDTLQPVRKITREIFGNKHSESHSVSLKQSSEVLVITGLPADKHKSITSYIPDYMSIIRRSDAKFMITDEEGLDENEWIVLCGKFTFISADEFRADVRKWRKENRTSTSSYNKKKSQNVRGGKVKYPILDVQGGTIEWVEYPDIPAGIGYLSEEDFFDHSSFSMYVRNLHDWIGHDKNVSSNTLSLLALPFPKVDKILLLGGGRKLEALKTRVKRVRNLKPMVLKCYESLNKLKTDPDVVIHYTMVDNRYTNLVKKAVYEGIATDVSDPILRSAINPKAKGKAKYDKIIQANSFDSFFRCVEIKESILPQRDRDISKSLEEKYPLANISSYSASKLEISHAIKYINMVHRESKKVDN